MLSRLRQFREATTGPNERDLRMAEELLSGSLRDLFMAQERRDIRHGVNTARWLKQRGHEDRELIQAALLHDIGKGRQRRWHRVAYVVVGWMKAERLLAASNSRWELRRAVARSASHAETGADALAASGASDAVVQLTRLHHVDRPQDVMLKLLNEADAAS